MTTNAQQETMMQTPLHSRFAARCAFTLGAACLLTLGLFGAAGCRSTPPAPPVATDGAETTDGSPIARLVPQARMLDETPLRVNQTVPEKALVAKNDFTMPVRQATPVEPPKSEYPSQLIKGLAAATDKKKVSLNLDATPITEIVPLFADLLKFNYYIDPAVKGAATMAMAETEMTAREVWELFEHILWLSGAYASQNPGFIQIVPFNKMPQERRLFATHDPVANVEVAFIPVRNAKSAEIAGNLKPFMTEGSSLTDIQRTNTLLIVETPANMRKLTELIKRLDDKGSAGWPLICLRCQQVDAETIRDELTALLPVLGLPVTDKASSGGEIKLVAVPRMEVILASAAMPDALEEVKRWFEVLDRENVAELENIFFYNVRHSTADTLTEALGVFFNTSGSSGKSSKKSTSKSTSSKAPKSGGATTEVTPAPPPVTSGGSTATKRQAGDGNTLFDTPVTVYADSDQNRLTIQTTPRCYAMVEALLKRLDVPPRQVLIQATIAEITLNKGTEFGFSYAARNNVNGGNLGWAMQNSGRVFDEADATSGSIAEAISPNTFPAGVAMLFTSKDKDRMAFIRAVAGESNVRVLSAPQILASNDKEAVINVGDKVPIITGDYTDLNGSTTTDNQNTYRSVQYQDTGTILTVTPHITAGNEVRLEVKQEVSEAVPTESSAIDSPTIQNRTLETQCVVPDGSTIMMGGLIKTKVDESHAGIPLLKDIPWLGKLFRSNKTVNNRTELLVMLTVNVVEPTTEVDKLARRYQEALKEIRDKMGK